MEKQTFTYFDFNIKNSDLTLNPDLLISQVRVIIVICTVSLFYGFLSN